MSALDQRSTMTPTLEQMSEHGHPPSPNCLLSRAGSDSPNHSPTCLPLAGGTGTLTPKLELLYGVLRYCDVRDLVRLAATSKFNMMSGNISTCAGKYWPFVSSITWRASIKYYQLAMLLSLDLLRCTCFCLAPTRTGQPSDLDVYVPACAYRELKAWFVWQGYCVLHAGNRNVSAYE